MKRSVPFADIVSTESVQYRPVAEFGGWGIRGMGKKKAWTARGNQAVVLTLANDRLLYVGSDRPEQLEEHISPCDDGGFPSQRIKNISLVDSPVTIAGAFRRLALFQRSNGACSSWAGAIFITPLP